MMKDDTIRTFAGRSRGKRLTAALALATLGWMAACAGTDTPDTTPEIENGIAVKYAGGQVAVAGAGGGSSGTGGSSASGMGGSATSASGSGGGAMTGNAGSGTVAAGGSGSSGACDGFAVLEMKCGGGSCHGADQAGGLTNFALDEDTAQALVGEEDSSPLCSGGGILFNPDNAASSLVIQKMRGTASCGGQMPLGSAPLDDATIKCVQDWIESL